MFKLYQQLSKSSNACSFIKRSLKNASNSKVRRIENNPGVGKRLATLEEVQGVEDFEDLEADFYNVGKSYKEHLKEQESHREMVRLKIVKQKYFKETKTPSFLTWSDMLQIRYLHNKDPDEWTITKLSEGFPALPETIIKIIKTNYVKSESKIEKHNENVKNNWDSFKQGKLDLPPKLVKHLKNFTTRELNLKPFELPDHLKPKKINLKLVEGEFSDIIKSYQNLKSKNENNQLIESNQQLKITPTENKEQVDVEDTYVIGNIKYNKKHSVPFKELEREIESKKSRGKRLTEDEALILSQKKSEDIIETPPENSIIELNQIELEKSKKVALVQKKDDNKHLIYPQKIEIPKNKYKSGHTYKLNDCYYDSDGKFLYRVPGMG